MIQAKPKECSRCGKIVVLWQSTPKLCKPCASQVKSEDTAPNKPLYRTKEIKKVSDKQQRINAAYKVLRDAFMKSKPICEAQWEGCTYHSVECHHALGRCGANMLDSSTYRALCKNCHDLVGEQSDRAKASGLSGNRLDKRL